MIYEYGDMFSVWDITDLFMITTNATIKSNGALVMGRGIARRIRDMFPGVDQAIGSHIETGSMYGILVSPHWPDSKLGLFQVKYNWYENADPELIRYSMEQLEAWVSDHPEISRVDLNYPGIGNGGLPISEVEPIISNMNDKIHIWRFRR